MEYEKLQKEKSQAKQQERNLTGIPTQMKWDLEARSGLSLDDVRVHYHSDKPAKLGALAYTQGTQVHIGPGQEGHLRHELGHVVQQKLGLVRPNTRYPGGPALNTEEALEQQADAIGAGSYCQPMLSAGVPPVQRFEDPVVQAEGHITDIGNVVPSEDIHSLRKATKPTVVIVFEAMGVKPDECIAIYDQTKAYGGNTVCVFGLNTEVSNASDFDSRQRTLNTYQQSCNQRDGQHLLYTFSFRWTPITRKNNGYPMPFVEARGLVMQKAAEVVAKLKGPDDNSQYKFLYRWIDADARDDTTSSLNPEQLSALAEEDKMAVMTGRYDWRSTDTGAARQNYEAFITKFNQAEKELREYYDYLSRTFSEENRIEILKNDFINRILTLKHSASVGDAERQEIAWIVSIVHGLSRDNSKATTLGSIDNSYLPGYYYPESALMMNQAAHDHIVNSFPAAVSEDGAQDKESMRMLKMCYSPQISFKTELSVTKPLKNEFSAGTYWGSAMLKFLQKSSQSSRKDKAAFIVALKNVRQSAFDPGRWYFITSSEWNNWEVPNCNIADRLGAKQELFNQKRRELKDRLFNFLFNKDGNKTILQKIEEEIPSAS